MNCTEVKEWFNNNQGVLAAVGLLFAGIGFFLRWLFKRMKEPTYSKIIAGDVSAGRDVIIAESLVNVQTQNNSELHETVKEVCSELRQLPGKFELSIKMGKSTVRTDSDDFTKVKALIVGEPRLDKKKALRTVFYSSNDNVARLHASLGLANWCTLPEDSIDDLISVCDEGIKIAESIGATSEKAVLLAYKGRFTSFQFSEKDTEAASKRQASNLTGIPVITEQQRVLIIRELHRLDNLSHDCFKEAEDLAIKVKNYQALALVHSLFGEAAGERYIHFKYFEIDRAEEDKQLCKKALMSAKNIYAQIGDEIGVAYALYNLANKLRLFGEVEEATQLVDKVIEIANKHTENRLLNKAKMLRERLMSGPHNNNRSSIQGYRTSQQD